MFLRWNRSASTICAHQQTVSVRAAGIERVVCESCGHMSFSIAGDLVGSPSRDQFERANEKPRSMAG